MKKTSIKDYIRQEIEVILRESKIKFTRRSSIQEAESAANAADDQKLAQLALQKANLDKQKAGLDGQIAKLKQQIDAIEKK